MTEEKRVLKNGIALYSINNPASHGFFISLFLKAGAIYESPSESGITHFLEHVTIRNVNAVMDGGLYTLLDRFGIEFNASTYSEMVQFYLAGAQRNFDTASEVMGALCSPIILSSGEIAAERGRIKAEIRENDEKNSIAGVSNAVVHEGTSLAGSITGTPGSVSKITKSKLEEYRNRVFVPENLFLYVTGNFTKENIEKLSSLVGSWELGHGEEKNNIAPVSSRFGKRDGRVTVKSADFTMLRFNFDIDMQKISVPASDLIYDILFGGYNSRFFIEMSEKRGLVYDISGNVERYKNIGLLSFSYEIKRESIYEAVELSLSILLDISHRLLSEEESMKAGYVDNADMLYDDNRDLNFTFAYDNHVMSEGYTTMAQRAARYKEVTPHDIMQAASVLFAPENLTLVIKGKKKGIEIEKIEKLIEDYKKSFYGN